MLNSSKKSITVTKESKCRNTKHDLCYKYLKYLV